MLLHLESEIYKPQDFSIVASAAKLVRLSFNPSNSPDVDRLKILAAAFISELERQTAVNGHSAEAGREFAVARTHMQTASMFAVAGATAHLVK